MKATLSSSNLTFKPSKQLNKHIKSLKLTTNKHEKEIQSVLTNEDYTYLKTLPLEDVILSSSTEQMMETSTRGTLLNLQDVFQLSAHLKEKDSAIYLHELIVGTSVILPENEEIPRNEELDKRCNLLKMQQENREYKSMTKNVDSVRRVLPEDTISYQLKEINRQLIAVLQFVISVIVGFVFGFIGIEMMIGSLDFGFRLLLGIISSLIIGLAELYFLAKKLSE